MVGASKRQGQGGHSACPCEIWGDSPIYGYGIENSDVFIFDDNWGQDYIHDFDDYGANQDLINLSRLDNVDGMEDLEIHQVGANAVIYEKGDYTNSITVEGQYAGALGADDFVFGVDLSDLSLSTTCCLASRYRRLHEEPAGISPRLALGAGSLGRVNLFLPAPRIPPKVGVAQGPPNDAKSRIFGLNSH